MESPRYRSHLSWILILQTIFSIFLSTWYIAPIDASSTISVTPNVTSEPSSTTTAVTTTTASPAFPGKPCSGLHSNSCVANAFCNNNTCQCNDTFYNLNNACVSKAALNESCSGSKPCMDQHAECNGTCQCKSDYYNNNGTCSVQVALNEGCNDTKACLDSNAECNKTCQCKSDYFTNGSTCHQKYSLNENCSGNGTCKDQNAECNVTCQCKNNYYNNNGTCSPKVALNESCNDTKACLDSNAECNKTCQCKSDYFTNGSTCHQKAALNESCSGSKPCMDQHAECNGTCQCKIDYYNNNGTCFVRLGYGAVCDTAVVNMCNQNFTCRSNTNRCLCKNGFFRDNDMCYSVEQLKVTNLTRSTVEETSLSVTWKPPVVGKNFSYNVSLNNGMSSVVNVSSTRFESLTPGTLYIVSVVTSVVRDPGYSNNETESSPAVTNSFYTKPAMPGPLSASVYLGPNVNLTFIKSGGDVAFYIVSVIERESNKTWRENISSPGDSVYVTLLNQTAGAHCDVMITAYIGGISSDTRTATYRVAVDVAGEVTDLAVNQSGSRWAYIRWRRPTRPNGEIQGYTVEVAPLNNSTCISGVAVLCSNCNDTNSTSLKMPDISNCTKNDTKKQTFEDLKSDTTWQEVNVTWLSPYVSYQVTVAAVNEKGRGQESKKDFKTQSEAAENLINLTVEEPLTVGQLNIKWVPGEKTGNTSYNVTWREENSIGSEQFIYKSSSIVYGYTQNSYTITGLLSYWNYRVSVRPSTEIGLSPEENHTVARTLDSVPGEVEIFEIYQPPDSATYLQFTVRCPQEKERNGIITFFVFKSSVPVNETLGSVSATKDCNENYTFNASVKAETNYSFEAFANTSKHEGIFKTRKYYVAPKAPMLPPNPELGFGESLLKNPAASGVTKTTAVLSICPCLVTDRSQGKITLAGLIVCIAGTEACNTSSDPNYFRSGVMTWQEFKEKDYKGSYRPTPDDWHETQPLGSSRRKRSTFLSRSIRETVSTIEFTLGGGVSCETQNNKRVYCNGPLVPGITFVVKVFACTAGGCKEADSGITITTLPEDGPNVGAIVGGVLGAFAGVVIIVLIIVFVMRRRRRSMEKPHKYVSSVKRTPTRRPIKLQDFKAHLDLLHSDSNLRFQEEFEDIQEKSPKGYSQDAATTDANKVKNRYVNILPYDHTRVKLTTADDDETSDFINANYIPGFSSPREYIATQGPMTGTVDDFWRMIWEQKSGVIVMLSDLQEKGRPKVDLYWPTEPNSPVQYGDIVVELKSSSTLNKYTIRDFIISMESQEKRKVLQFFIPGWEDYSANLDSDDVLDFIQAVRQQARTARGPVTVHCSAGVGRTGTFIALDFLMQYVNENDLDADVDIYNLVLNMRHNRPHMVQSEKQYIFIHDTLKVIIDKKIKSMQDESIYMNTNNGDSIYANTNPAFEPDENLYMNTDAWKPTTSL